MANQQTEAQQAAKHFTNGNLYNVTNAVTGTFLMTAPMKTLALVFNLRDAAINRVAAEAGITTACLLHFNGKTYLNASEIRVVLK